MMGKKDQYRRWDYGNEMEISVEEQLTLGLSEEETFDHFDDHDTHSTTTFTEPSVILSLSRTPTTSSFSHSHKFNWLKAKVQLVLLSAALLLVGFLLGFGCGSQSQDRRKRMNVDSEDIEMPGVSSGRISQHLNRLTDTSSPSSPASASTAWNTHELNESTLDKLIAQISADNIRHNLKRMSQEVHGAGTPEGHSMAMALRDLWRTYGLSVRVEQHKAFITRPSAVNVVEAIDVNGTLLYRSSEGDELNLRSARPFMAFSPPADLMGTLIYGHYGTLEDWKYLEVTQIPVNGSIALIRFGPLHPSNIVATALKFGVAGLIFYPDPADFGPVMPSSAFRRGSLLSMEQILQNQETEGDRNGESWRKLSIPSHTISSSEAEYLFRLMKARRGRYKMREDWEGGLKSSYSLGGSPSLLAHLRLFNEEKERSIYNVVAAIPGAWESDRYVIIGASHDSWTYGAGDPGIGLGILSEIARVFASSVQKGWKSRRSILFISWDANLYASSGVAHWLQEHYFEISSRAVAYIDLTRTLQGNQTLRVHCSPVLREVTKKAIARVKHFEINARKSGWNNMSRDETNLQMSGSDGIAGGNSNGGEEGAGHRPPPIDFSSAVNTDESSFAFFGNLGIPFIRPTVLNSPKDYDYPLFHTSFDTFDNFQRHVDPNFKGSETIGRIISGLIVFLADSSLLPINVEDYVSEIQKAFGSFMSHYAPDLHKANLSIAYLQAAVMRLEVIGDNFRTEVHNRSVIINNEHEHELPLARQIKTKKLLFHRIINDKLMGLDRAFLSRDLDPFKHLILGFSSCSGIVSLSAYQNPNKTKRMRESDKNKGTGAGFSAGPGPGFGPTLPTTESAEKCFPTHNSGYNYHFPKLRAALNCGRRLRALSESKSHNNYSFTKSERRHRDTLKNRSDKDIQKQFGGKLKKPINTKSEINNKSEQSDSGRNNRERNGSGSVMDGGEELQWVELGADCVNWREDAGAAVTGLIRALDAAAALLQSPLLPEESDSAAVT